MKPKEDLLEKLARLSGCPFLSDLHLPENREKVACALDMLQPEEYPPEAWREAVRYLLGSAGPPPAAEKPDARPP